MDLRESVIKRGQTLPSSFLLYYMRDHILASYAYESRLLRYDRSRVASVARSPTAGSIFAMNLVTPTVVSKSGTPMFHDLIFSLALG